MYTPKHFAETRVEVLHELIRTHPFGALIVLSSNGLDANHIPFEIDPHPAPFGTLRGHVARANPVWHDHSQEIDTLVIFQGPHAYISPAWYETKKETGKVVPTWNYAVVHALGPLRAIDDRTWVRAFVERFTDHHEAQRADPWKVSDAPADFIDSMTAAIVGIEVPIVQLTGKWKVSQNRPQKDRAGVVDGLMQQPSDTSTAMAKLVQSGE